MTSRATSGKEQVQKEEQLSLMPGFQAASKKQTSIDKLQHCNSFTQEQKLLPILLPDSISAELDSVPFWNEFVQAMSDALWLPTRIDSPGAADAVPSAADLICSNGYLSKTTANSWFSTKITSRPKENWLRISKPKVHVFSCRIYGLRKYKQKIKEDKELQTQSTT